MGQEAMIPLEQDNAQRCSGAGAMEHASQKIEQQQRYGALLE